MRASVKILKINQADRDKKHDYDLIVCELENPNNEIWLQVRRTQTPLLMKFDEGNNATITFNAEYSEQSATANGKAYRHNNLILSDITEVMPEHLKFNSHSTEELLNELDRRGLSANEIEEVIQVSIPKPKHQRHSLEQPENVELFVEYSDKLRWQQWNYIFKEVARKPFKERQKMPHDYSMLLNETIS
jgi:hypothetical protein